MTGLVYGGLSTAASASVLENEGQLYDRIDDDGGKRSSRV